jgi:hypothetical protein
LFSFLPAVWGKWEKVKSVPIMLEHEKKRKKKYKTINSSEKRVFTIRIKSMF